MEFNKTVMTGAVVSVDTTMVVASHMDVSVRHSVSVEHLQHQQTDCRLPCMHAPLHSCVQQTTKYLTHYTELRH